jgi:hypothetical protein
MADWTREFDDPAPLPRGRQRVTLKDAANYIQKLPKAEQLMGEWQAAVEAVIIRSWAANACARRNDAGPARRKANSRIQSIEGKTLGKAEAEAGRMTGIVYDRMQRGMTAKELTDV